MEEEEEEEESLLSTSVFNVPLQQRFRFDGGVDSNDDDDVDNGDHAADEYY